MLPLIGLSLSASTGNIYAGLYYPIAVAALCFVCGVVLLKETGSTLISVSYTHLAYEFNSDITTGISADPIGITSITPNTNAMPSME